MVQQIPIAMLRVMAKPPEILPPRLWRSECHFVRLAAAVVGRLGRAVSLRLRTGAITSCQFPGLAKDGALRRDQAFTAIGARKPFSILSRICCSHRWTVNFPA